MSAGLFGNLLRIGAAAMQHAKFVNDAVSANESKRHELLTTYVRGLTDVAFGGLKTQLAMTAMGEPEGPRKAAMMSLLQNLDAARAGKTPQQLTAASGPQTADEVTEVPEGDPDLALLNSWFDVKDDEKRLNALLNHLMTLNDRTYAIFSRKLQILRTNKVQQIENHNENELNSWGGYFEDRMAYFMASQRTGQKDPRWVAAHRELQGHLQFIEWVTKACDGAWRVISQRRSGASKK